MSSSESSTKKWKAGSDHRGRTMVACIACKQRKQKCDGQSPACRHCVRAKRACLVEDPITKRQQPRAYLQFLEERVAMLETMLHETHTNFARNHYSASTEEQLASDAPTPGDLSEQSIPRDDVVDDRQRDRGNNIQGDRSNVNGLSSNVGLLCLNVVGHEPRYLGASSSFAFSQIISSSLQRLQLQGPGMSMAGISDPLLMNQPQALPCPLPSSGVGAILLQAYFDEVHPQYPFLHKDTIIRWEKIVLQAGASEDETNADPVMMYFVNMVYAVGSLILQYNSEGSAQGFHAAARQHLDYVIQLNNVESIQAILCCATYSLRSPVGVSVWSLSGLALRHCIELGYHRNTRKFHPKEDPLRLELRKRVFWCSYSMDRAAAVTLGRPFGVMDKDIDIEFPLDINDSQITSTMVYGHPRMLPVEPTTIMSAAIHTFHLRRIWSKIHDTLYSISNNSIGDTALIVSLRAELDKWRVSTPSPMQPSSTKLSAFSSFEWFQVAYDHSILLLYRPQITSKEIREKSPSSSTTAYRECFQASQEICQLYRRIFIANAASCSWGSLHILFLAGLTYLYCLWTSYEIRQTVSQRDIYGTCTACTVVLTVMAERWKAAASYRDLFDTLANRTIDVFCKKDFEEWSEDSGAANLPILGRGNAQIDPLMGELVMEIAQSGMSVGVETLLTDFVGDQFSA